MKVLLVQIRYGTGYSSVRFVTQCIYSHAWQYMTQCMQQYMEIQHSVQSTQKSYTAAGWLELHFTHIMARRGRQIDDDGGDDY